MAAKKPLIKAMELSWITVKNCKTSRTFFTETLDLTLEQDSAEAYGWLELQGAEGGMVLGVAQAQENGYKPGSHAIVTMVVDHLEEAIATLKSRGVQFLDDVMEVPGHVKMITFADPDGNHFQLVEKLDCK